jgi:hypothetical protein
LQLPVSWGRMRAGTKPGGITTAIKWVAAG